MSSTLTCPQSSSDREEPEKHKYEDEAEESDDDFINDEEEDEESGSESSQVRNACAALRSRRSWQTIQTSCPLCADLRAVLCHLLDLH